MVPVAETEGVDVVGMISRDLAGGAGRNRYPQLSSPS